MSTITNSNLNQVNKSLFIKIAIATFTLGLITHGFCFANSFFTHDGLEGISSGIGSGQWEHKIALGRFLHPLYYFVRGHIAAPWLIGMIALSWLALSNYLMAKLFNFSKTWMNYILCGLVVTNLALCSTFATCIHEGDTYMLALFLSVLSVYSFMRLKYGWILAVICTFCSAAFYQAYFAFAIALFITILIKDILNLKSAKSCFVKGAKYAAVLFVSIICYQLTSKIIQNVTGCLPPTAYISSSNSIFYGDGMPHILTLFQLAGKTSKMFFLHYWDEPTAYPFVQSVINIILALLCIAGIIRCIILKKISTPSILLITILLLLLPFGTNIIYFLTATWDHTVMQFAFCTPHLLCLVILNENELKINIPWQGINRITVTGLSFIIFSGAVLANQLYLQRQLVSKNDLSIKTRILYELEHHPEYKPNETPIAFIGSSWASPLNKHRTGFEHLKGIFGASANFSLTHYRTIAGTFKTELGYPAKLASRQDTYDLEDKEEVQAMPFFPERGYMKMVDGYLVIKISGWTPR